MALPVKWADEVEEDAMLGVTLSTLGGSCVVRALEERRGDIDLGASEVVNQSRQRQSNAVVLISEPEAGVGGVKNEDSVTLSVRRAPDKSLTGVSFKVQRRDGLANEGWSSGEEGA
jgi:hypothetical protein